MGHPPQAGEGEGGVDMVKVGRERIQYRRSSSQVLGDSAAKACVEARPRRTCISGQPESSGCNGRNEKEAAEDAAAAAAEKELSVMHVAGDLVRRDVQVQ